MCALGVSARHLTADVGQSRQSIVGEEVGDGTRTPERCNNHGWCRMGCGLQVKLSPGPQEDADRLNVPRTLQSDPVDDVDGSTTMPGIGTSEYGMQ